MAGEVDPENLPEGKRLAGTIQDVVRRPIPLVAAVVAALAIALAVWWASRNNEHGTRRWESGGTASESSSFRRLVKASGPGVFSHLLIYLGFEEAPGPIITKWTDWSRPHLSVYSVPAPAIPQVLPTLRDLGDNGQAHAIDFLAKDPAKEKEIWSELQEALRDKKVFLSRQDRFMKCSGS